MFLASMQVELPGVGWLYSEAPEHMHLQFDQQLLQRMGPQTIVVSADMYCLRSEVLIALQLQ